jgi:hypothetical protein
MIVSAFPAETPVSNPESTIDTFARQFQITQEEAQIVKEALPGAGGHHVPRHQCLYQGCPGWPPDPHQDAYRLERVGGQILNLVK